MKNIHTGQVKSLLCLYTAIFMYYVKYTQRELNTRRGQQGFRTLCCDVCGLLENQFLRNNNNKGSRSNVNKHELVYGESSSNARDAPNICLSFVLLFTIFIQLSLDYLKMSNSSFNSSHFTRVSLVYKSARQFWDSWNYTSSFLNFITRQVISVFLPPNNFTPLFRFFQASFFLVIFHDYKVRQLSFERRICAQTQDLKIFKKFIMSQMNQKEVFLHHCILSSTTLHSPGNSLPLNDFLKPFDINRNTTIVFW